MMDLKVRQPVKYLGGSKARYLRTGAIGIVRAITRRPKTKRGSPLYSVLIGKRQTTISGKHLKASGPVPPPVVTIKEITQLARQARKESPDTLREVAKVLKAAS